MDGKIILDTASHIAEAPDGNGGLYAALRKPLEPADPSRTVISDLKARGIKYIHAYGVDNCLVRVADPVFVGWGVTKGTDCAVKVVRKTLPTESVGVVAVRGAKYGVIEYSEISSEQATRLDPASGQLAFRAANIANHFYTTAFLESIEKFEDALSFHIARKKIPCIDLTTSELVKPAKPNGMKLELFVFDVFPFSKQFAVLEVERTEEFSPLKNAPGTGSDDPGTSRRDTLAQHKRYLEQSGATLEDGLDIELSPAFTYAGEGIGDLKGLHLTKAGVVNTAEDLKALAS
jgi:UDP-N-acetylglucosamine/UDP-N-acetylgalactosamine diphosphorylase